MGFANADLGDIVKYHRDLRGEAEVGALGVSAARATIGRRMGVTEELAIGQYFKRPTAVQDEFGPADHHPSRYASLRGSRAISARIRSLSDGKRAEIAK